MLEKRGDEYSLSELSSDDSSVPSVLRTCTSPLHKSTIQSITGQSIDIPNRLLATNNSYADLALGFPDLMVRI